MGDGGSCFRSYIYRMVSADSIVPDPFNPQSFNRYSYVRNNPINFVDPTGHCDESHADYKDCLDLKGKMEGDYQLNIDGPWWLSELELVEEALVLLTNSMSSEGFIDAFSGLNLIRQSRGSLNIGRAVTQGLNRIVFTDIAFVEYDADKKIATTTARDPNDVFKTTIHEFSHIWDNRTGNSLSEGLMNEVGGQYEYCFFRGCGDYDGFEKTCFLGACRIYTVTDNSPHPGANPDNHKEDWAWTFSAFVVDPNSLGILNNPDLRTPYITEQIEN